MPSLLKTQVAVNISPLAGKPAPPQMLIDPVRHEREYYERRPDPRDPGQMVRFGTSGHRGTSLRRSFNEALRQATCDYRAAHGTDGPVYMGKDTHAPSAPAQRTALEVLAGNGVETIIQQDDAVTPTPVISHAILVYNGGCKDHFADGIVITPSHNPPQDGGFKYNPANGGPADTHATKWIEDRANELLRHGNAGVKRMLFASVLNAGTHAPGNGAPIGGLKVVTASGWFAARPSGTEDIYKIYAESFLGEAHLKSIVSEEQEIVVSVLESGA